MSVAYGIDSNLDPVGVADGAACVPNAARRQKPDGVALWVACRWPQRDSVRLQCGTPLGFDGYKWNVK